MIQLNLTMINYHMKGNFMNRSKLIGATALASVMAAGAAHAEMSINGYFAGTLTDNDGGGLASTFSTNSIYVSYSDSMDNGMGVGLTMSVTATGIKTSIGFDTGMGTIGLGSNVDVQVNSITFSVALDKIGFMPLISVDSMSGIIVTDWYSLDDGESRIKINVRVVDQEMTNESLIVSLFTQSLDGDRWIDQGISSEQSLKIKESILTSARSLKVASEL